MVIFSRTSFQLTSSQIENIEEYVTLSFPAEYKDHLLRHNGGRCNPNIFGFIENGEYTESCIDWFLGIDNGEYDNLQEYIKILKLDEKRLPSHMLPIANDPGGNIICISCDKRDRGYVYFWDHENEVDYTISDDDDYSNLYLIARNFNEFISELK